MIRLLAILLTLLAGPAAAHFSDNGQARMVVLDRETGMLWLRIPAPLIFAQELSQRDTVSGAVTSPFIETVEVNGRWGHRLDTTAIAEGPAFMDKVAGGYRLTGPDGPLPLDPVAVAIHRLDRMEPFTTPDEARTSLAAPWADAPWVSDAVVEIAIRLSDVPRTLTLQSTLPQIPLPPTVFIDNHLFDWQGGGVQRIEVLGQLTEPVTMERNLPRTLALMVREGISHILEGFDHVLFVVCLTLAATGLRPLLIAVTGFTLGHSVTLIAGVLGFSPTGLWFPPAVEAAIAASIIWTGLLALFGKGHGPGFWLTAMLGLLHGFGFSFVLGQALGRQAPDLVASLLTFNIGVEIGQLIIVATVLIFLDLLRRAGPAWARGASIAVAGGAVAFASVLLVQRLDLIARMI